MAIPGKGLRLALVAVVLWATFLAAPLQAANAVIQTV